MKIELGEKFGAAQLIEKFLNYRYWKLIIHCTHIESPIINAKSPRIVWLADQ